MKQFRRLFALLVILVCAALLFSTAGLADAGNFAGSSDYGGSDWGGSSDWGSSSDWDNDSDWDSDTSIPIILSDGAGGGTLFPLLIVLVIIYLVFRKNKKKSAGVSRPGAQPTPSAMLRSLEEYKALDPGFSLTAFQEMVGNRYVQMQQCWQDKKFEPMRPHMTESLYNQFLRQLEEYIRNGRTNRVEKIAVLDVRPMGFMQNETDDSIVVRLKTRIIDYDVEDATGKVLSGSKDTELYMEYEWTLVRAKGTVTGAQDDMQQHHCPSCGAPIEKGYSAKCEYCGNVLTGLSDEWTISAIKGISRRSA